MAQQVSAGSGWPKPPAPLGHSAMDRMRTIARRHAATSTTMLTFTRQRIGFPMFCPWPRDVEVPDVLVARPC